MLNVRAIILVLSDGCLKKVYGPISFRAGKILDDFFYVHFFSNFHFQYYTKDRNFPCCMNVLIGKETSESRSGGKLYFHLRKM